MTYNLIGLKNPSDESRYNCPKSDCPRMANGYPFLFRRSDESLKHIRILVLSEELPSGCKGKVKDCESDSNIQKKIENHLNRQTLEKKGTVPKYICKIISDKFDILNDPIYWTHTLKCIPEKNHEAPESFECCCDFLKQEIIEIFCSSDDLKGMIVFGGIVFGRLCVVLEKLGIDINRIKREGKITDNIKSSPRDGYAFTFNDKEYKIFPFYHPSWANRWLKENPGLGEKIGLDEKVGTKVGTFIDAIRKIYQSGGESR